MTIGQVLNLRVSALSFGAQDREAALACLYGCRHTEGWQAVACVVHVCTTNKALHRVDIPRIVIVLQVYSNSPFLLQRNSG